MEQARVSESQAAEMLQKYLQSENQLSSAKALALEKEK